MAVAVGLTFMVTLRLNQFITGSLYNKYQVFNDCRMGIYIELLYRLALFISRGSEYIQGYTFLTKMMLVTVSAVILFWLRRRLKSIDLTTEDLLMDRKAKTMSLLSTVTWFGAVIAGRLIAYISDIYDEPVNFCLGSRYPNRSVGNFFSKDMACPGMHPLC